MSTELIFTPAASDNPLELARRRLLRAIAAMAVPRPIGSFPTAGDFEAIDGFLRQAAEPMDAFIADVGFEVHSNAGLSIDMKQFENVVTNAIAGNATWEVERARQARLDERREVA